MGPLFEASSGTFYFESNAEFYIDGKVRMVALHHILKVRDIVFLVTVDSVVLALGNRSVSTILGSFDAPDWLLSPSHATKVGVIH